MAAGGGDAVRLKVDATIAKYEQRGCDAPRILEIFSRLGLSSIAALKAVLSADERSVPALRDELGDAATPFFVTLLKKELEVRVPCVCADLDRAQSRIMMWTAKWN